MRGPRSSARSSTYLSGLNMLSPKIEQNLTHEFLSVFCLVGWYFDDAVQACMDQRELTESMHFIIHAVRKSLNSHK